MSEQAYQAPATPDRSLSTPEPQRTGSWKTPIQILYEHGVVSGDLPVFVMEKAEGEAHQPSFIFSVTIGGVKCTGQGPSKKAAKQQAAEAALKILNIDSESGAVSGRSKTNGVIVAEPNNPVGLLQVLALQRGWSEPQYITSTASGPPHQKEFTIICRLESLSLAEQGVGNTKRAAKKEAAEKMVVKLQSLSGSSEITWNPKPSDRTDFQGDKTPQLPSQPSMNPSNSPNGEMVSLDTVNPEKNNPESKENYEVLCDYPMTGKRGMCLIVDNFDFSKSVKPLKNREGTEFDRKALKEVFEWLGYEVETHENCKAAKIKELFHQIAKQNHRQNDSLVCCILSHGQEGEVHGVDGKSVAIKVLTQIINGENCPTLIEKPKMLFIQACQGKKEQFPVQPDGIEDETTQIFADAEVADMRSPVTADMLVGMSTVPDHVSYRDKFCGTWYIQSLCKNLIKFVPRRVDLVTILTIVNSDVGGMTDPSRSKKQMPQPAFSFRKRVVFPVPEKPPPKIGAFTKDNS